MASAKPPRSLRLIWGAVKKQMLGAKRSEHDRPWPLTGGGSLDLDFLPFLPDSGEAEGTELELLAEPPEEHVFELARAERASHIIGSLALPLKIDQGIGR